MKKDLVKRLKSLLFEVEKTEIKLSVEELEDGTKIQIDDETLEVSILDENGEVKEPLQDGEYTLKSGAIILVEGGKIVESITAENFASAVKKLKAKIKELEEVESKSEIEELEDGTKIKIDEDSLEVFVLDENGEVKEPLEDGEYTLKSGVVITVEAGKIIDKITPENFSSVVKKLKSKVKELETDLKKEKEEFEAFKKQPSTTPIDLSSLKDKQPEKIEHWQRIANYVKSKN